MKKIFLPLIFIVLISIGSFYYYKDSISFECDFSYGNMPHKSGMYVEGLTSIEILYKIKIKNKSNRVAKGLLGKYEISKDLEKYIVDKIIFEFPLTVKGKS